MTVDSPEAHERLVQSLLDERRWPAGGPSRRRIDTHISTVILAGDHAYKLKKPLDLGFLDFLDLDAREQACREELRLNRRLAPDIYQAVCAITGSVEAPSIDGPGPVIDWAVRMRRFDPDAILANLADRMSPALIDRLAARVAAFHAAAAVCPPGEPFGTPDAVFAPMQQNFAQIGANRAALTGRLQSIEVWSRRQRQELAGSLQARKTEGHIRECHGDLHLGNVALIADAPVVFDAIEFNPGLRWIDTVNDVAFLTMDLHHRGRAALAYRFLDRYLQANGDYPGLRLLRFYEVYRALVRAKIAAIRGRQGLSAVEQRQVDDECRSYVDLAADLAHAARGAIVITHGVSGSGKSHVAAQLPGTLPAVRLRSDVERKRLLGLDPRRDASALGAYAADVTAQTYNRLARFAEQVARAGLVAVVDATFLRAADRQRFRVLAEALQVSFLILDCDAPPATLRERIQRRRQQGDNVSDADLEVLEGQLSAREPLADAERPWTLAVRPRRPLSAAELAQRLDGVALSAS